MFACILTAILVCAVGQIDDAFSNSISGDRSKLHLFDALRLHEATHTLLGIPLDFTANEVFGFTCIAYLKCSGEVCTKLMADLMDRIQGAGKLICLFWDMFFDCLYFACWPYV